MKKLGWLLAGVFLLAPVLSGCSVFNLPLGPQMYRGAMNPISFGYEVTDAGLVVASNSLAIEVAAGAPGGYLQRYSIDYFDNNDNLLRTSEVTGGGTVGLRIPPGYRDTAQGRVFENTRSAAVTGISLDGDVALLHYNAILNNRPVRNWRAEVTYTVITDSNYPVTWTDTYRILTPQ